MYSID